MKLQPKTCEPEWRATPGTLTEWAKCCVTWLASAHECEPATKWMVTSSTLHRRENPTDPDYKKIMKMQYLARSALRNPNDIPRIRKLQKLVREQGWEEMTVDQCLEEINQELQRHLDACKHRALDEWRAKVHTWIPSAKQLYDFIRNEPAGKVALLKKSSGAWVTLPMEIYQELNAYWGSLERWPSEEQREHAYSVLEDSYSLLLPHVPMSLDLTTEAILDKVKRLKHSSPGPDGWSTRELRALPKVAWQHLVRLWKISSVEKSFFGLFKRIPVAKVKDQVPDATQIRPIDVFSQVTRLVSAVLVDGIRPWLVQILHQSQFASLGGALCAVSRLNLCAELSAHGLAQFWCLAVDFTKLFNTIDPRLVARACCYMGLDRQVADWLIDPLVSSKGVWRLPENGTVPFFKTTRGIAQGLSSSVVLSEIFLSILLRQLSAGAIVDIISYVDDLHLVAQSKQELEKARNILFRFAEDFAVGVSRPKSYLWGTNAAELERLGEEWGIPFRGTVESLGVEWQIHRKWRPSYSKERERVQLAKTRLARLYHLPSSIHLKASAVLIGCLSLLDYAPTCEPKMVHPLKVAVKSSLGLTWAAPEIVFHVWGKGSIDPDLRWILASLRLLKLIAPSREFSLLIAGYRRSLRGSRLAALARKLDSLGWAISEQGVHCPSRFSWTRAWSEIREKVIEEYKKLMIARLVARRPDVYDGQTSLNHEKHVKFLKSLPSYAQVVITRIWSGCAMTGAHRHTINHEEQEKCPCGHDRQDVRHLLYTCPLTTGRPFFAFPWSTRPPAQSVAMLCPSPASAIEVDLWTHMCKFAIHAISSRPTMEPTFDYRGHEVTLDATQEYAYCIKCLVVRRLKDYKFIAARPCEGFRFSAPCIQGDYFKMGDHVFRCEFASWKRAASRPKLICCKCALSFWPSSPDPTRPCAG